MGKRTIFSLVMSLGTSGTAMAVHFRGGTGAGMLVQPTSAYFHAAYSGYIDVASDKEGVILRGTYVERPRFEAGGYIDQEYGFFGLIGTKVTDRPTHGLNCYVGYGLMRGYLAAEREQIPDSDDPIRRFSLPGPVVTLEYAYSWSAVRVAIEHIGFTGFGDSAQTEARVAWPYNIMLINIGMIW